MLKHKCVPTASCKLFQNSLVEIGSQSLTMLEGIPWSRTISLRYVDARDEAVLLLLTGIKWALFVSLSTITQMLVLPLLDLGISSIKSIEMMSHFHCGTSKG